MEKSKNFTINDLAEMIKKNSTKIDKILIKQINTEENIKKLATKEELTEAKDEIMKSVDGVVNEQENFKSELAADHGAHNRIQDDLNEVREHAGLKIKHQTLQPEVV